MKNWNKIINLICAILLVLLGGYILYIFQGSHKGLAITINPSTCKTLGVINFSTPFGIYFILVGIITFSYRHEFNFITTITHFIAAFITATQTIKTLHYLSDYLEGNCFGIPFRDPTPLWLREEPKLYLFLTLFIIVPQIFLILNMMKSSKTHKINSEEILDQNP